MICSSVNLSRFICRPSNGPDSNQAWKKIRGPSHNRRFLAGTIVPTRPTAGGGWNWRPGNSRMLPILGSGFVESLAPEAIGRFSCKIKEVLAMSVLWFLSKALMRRIEPYFPLSHGIPRMDDRRIVSGIICVTRN